MINVLHFSPWSIFDAFKIMLNTENKKEGHVNIGCGAVMRQLLCHHMAQ